MPLLRLTNARREHDATTQAARKCVFHLAAEVEDAICEGSSDRLRLGGYLLFNYAVLLHFGTREFAKAFKPVTSWDDETKASAVATAMDSRSKNVFAFTDVYSPPRLDRHCERKTDEEARARYMRVCRGLQVVWEFRASLVESALEGRSWQHLVERFMWMTGWGGTGFLAKELALDMVTSPLGKTYNTGGGGWTRGICRPNLWCPVGPGARRGLNRLNSRSLDFRIKDSSPEAQEMFMRDLISVYNQRHEQWPDSIEGFPAGPIELHDVQFALCEFDKFEKLRIGGQGNRRPYRFPEADVPNQCCAETSEHPSSQPAS